jgi:tripartite-type tricarboxylate transporter receptor subunit TctC
MKPIVIRLLGILTAIGGCAVPVAAQTYPTKSIRLIVPFAPGGGTDLLARLIAPRLGEVLGQQFVVDNRGGAGSVIGTELVAKAPPDGYTLGFLDTAFAINPAIAPSLPYATEKDFAILNIVGTSPTVLVVHSSVPAKTLKELITYAKNNPGKLTFGSAGPNSAGHLTGEMFKAAAGVNITHVPFKGAGAAITDLLGGHIDITYATPGSIDAHVQAGTLRALAITGSKPSPVLPNVPTFASLGLPSVNPGSFRFLAGQAAMPASVQQRLVAGMEKLAHIPSLATRMGELGYDPTFIGPPGSREYVLAEMQKWRKVMHDSAMKVN